MKKKQLKDIIAWLDNFIRMNERHMQIQDNALIRKDKEITILTNACKELKTQLEETQEALSRSRSFIKIIQSDKKRSIEDMAKSLYDLYYGSRVPEELRRWWEDLVTWEKEYWMSRLIEILSWEKVSQW